MADPRKNKSINGSSYQGYRPNYSNHYAKHKSRQDDETTKLIRRFSIQVITCLCLLMSVFIIQKLPQTQMYQMVKTMFLSEMPFQKHKNQYEKFLANMFPFEYALPNTNKEDETITASGLAQTETSDAVSESEQINENFSVSSYLSQIHQNIVLDDFHHGVIIKTEIDESILSLVPGIVIHIGIDPDISNYMSIELDNEMILTVGFLEKRVVSLYEHVKQGESLGSGSVIAEAGTELGDYAYYYLELQKDGEYLDISEFLGSLMN